MRLPGMKYAVIARPPVTGGKLDSFDSPRRMKVSGVEKVMEVKGWPWPSKFQPLGGVAVIARNTGAAIMGRDALKVVVGRWRQRQILNSVSLSRGTGRRGSRAGQVVRKEGDAEAALKSADKVVVGEYYLPHFAHVSMEPPVAVAKSRRQGRDLGAGPEPRRNHEDVAKTSASPRDNVTVNVTLLGGGFGRKSKCEFALEAALLSKAIGAPVKVQ